MKNHTTRIYLGEIEDETDGKQYIDMYLEIDHDKILDLFDRADRNFSGSASFCNGAIKVRLEGVGMKA